jgi:glucan phosphoethanolaminetransferase (alkaline phosphatase superfamily)
MASQSGPTWRSIPAVVAPLLVALFIVAFDNRALWLALLASFSQTPPLLTMTAAFVLLTAVFTALLQAINFPWIFKPIAALMLFVAAVTRLVLSHCARHVRRTDQCLRPGSRSGAGLP